MSLNLFAIFSFLTFISYLILCSIAFIYRKTKLHLAWSLFNGAIAEERNVENKLVYALGKGTEFIIELPVKEAS